jgi:hypothetical protein
VELYVHSALRLRGVHMVDAALTEKQRAVCCSGNSLAGLARRRCPVRTQTETAVIVVQVLRGFV